MDGVDDRISTANRNNGPTAFPFSVVGVINPSTVTGFRSLFQYQFGSYTTTGFLLTIVDSGGMGWWIGSTQVLNSGAVLPTINKWYFIGVSSLNATTHRMYLYDYAARSVTLNVTSVTSGTFTNPASSFFHIGMDTGDDVTYSDFFGGTISYVAVYNKDFTLGGGDAFLATAFLGPYAVATPTNLWTFNEMTGTTVREQILNTNDGTMTSFPASPWIEGGLPSPWWEIGGRRRVSRPAIVSAGGAVNTRKTLMGVGI